jgi:hypothetical protein
LVAAAEVASPSRLNTCWPPVFWIWKPVHPFGQPLVIVGAALSHDVPRVSNVRERPLVRPPTLVTLFSA